MSFSEDKERDMVRVLINPILKKFNLPFLSSGGRADALGVEQKG